MTTRGWIGYDWFKLIVAIILAILLLWLWFTLNAASAVVAPVAATTAPAVAAAATGVTVSAPRLPALAAPAAGAAIAVGATSFNGTGEPGATVQVVIDGKPVGTAKVGSDGTWKLDAPLDTPGAHSVVVQTVDAAGAKLNEAAPVSLTVAAPTAVAATTAPTAAAQVPTVAAPTGALTAGPITLTGTGTPGEQVEVLVNGQPVGTATVGADGTWSLPTTLAAGDAEVSVRSASNPANISPPVKLTVGAGAAAPTATAQAPTLTVPTGPTAAGPVTLSGTGTPGEQVEVLVNGQPVGTATVGADGKWSLPATLAAGTDEVIVRSVGNPANASAPAKLTVDAAAATPAPAGQVIITAPADGTQVPAGTFSMSGTGTPGSKIEVLDGDKVVGTTTVGNDGTWQLDVPAPQGTGAYSARTVGSTEVATTATRITSGVVKTCTTIAVGCNAWVTRQGGFPLRLRAGPGTSFAIISRLPIGTQMLLNEGPQAANGFNWYKIKTVGGMEGWIAGEQVRLQPD